MNRNKLLLSFIVLFITCGCASGKKVQQKLLNSEDKKFQMIDKAGSYQVRRIVKHDKKKNEYVVYKNILSSVDQQELEKAYVISSVGRLKHITLLRPKKSQYTVWFNGKKYETRMDLDLEAKALKVRLESPEEQWQGQKNYPFPDSKGVYCFFSQVVECARITSFISKAIEKSAGEMNFYLIWEGFPYFHEQYLNLEKELFSKAAFRYEGKVNDGFYRFALNVSGQTIIFIVDKEGRMHKMFWVEQGLSMLPAAG